jgi:hypothetical protein
VVAFAVSASVVIVAFVPVRLVTVPLVTDRVVIVAFVPVRFVIFPFVLPNVVIVPVVEPNVVTVPLVITAVVAVSVPTLNSEAVMLHDEVGRITCENPDKPIRMNKNMSDFFIVSLF